MKLDRLSNKAQRQQLISAARPQYLLHLLLEIMQTIVYSSSGAAGFVQIASASFVPTHRRRKYVQR